MTQAPHILVIGFDWDDRARTDPALVLRKLVRDHIDPARADILLWKFAPTTGEFRIAPRVNVLNRRGLFRRFRILYDLLAPYLLARDLQRIGFAPDIVIVHDFPLVRAAHRVKRIFRSKLVFYLTNLPTDLAKTRRAAFLKAWYHRFFERRSVSFIDMLVAINGTTQAYARSIGISDGKIVVLRPDTIASDRVHIDAAVKGVVRARFRIPISMRIILSVGRLEPEKGFDRLIRAVAALDREDVALVIVGEGRLRASLETLARDSGIEERTHFAGFISREEIWNYYADADVFVLLSRSEALGLATVEAMYSGVPVITSGVGGLGELAGADGERGFLWTEDHGVESLEKKLIRCFDRNTVSPMLARAKEYATPNRESRDLTAVVSWEHIAE